MRAKARVFVGASSEGASYDREVRQVLEGAGLDVIPWQTTFAPGEYGLDSLERVTRDADGAILVASADDRTWYRGQEGFAPRDNVLFELGFFLHAFGRRRTALAVVEDDRGGSARMPSDLAGLTTIRLRPQTPAANEAELRRWASRFDSATLVSHPETREILETLRDDRVSVDPTWRAPIAQLVLAPFHRSIVNALRGEIDLTAGQYYSRLEAEISQAEAGTRILAVSTVSSQVWAVDRDQQDYFARNIDAARRGVEIRRLFVIPTELYAEMEQVIRSQAAAGIAVRVARPGSSALFSILDDVVMFVDAPPAPRMRGYVGLPAFDNPGRIRGGRLILDPAQCRYQQDAFEAVWSLAPPLTEAPPPQEPETRTRAPGDSMEVRWQGMPVVTCEEAATARGIPLMNELKTLILETTGGMIAAHLSGDEHLSLRSVRDYLEAEDVRLASPEVLDGLGLMPGTVSAVLEPVWSLPHLIDRELLLLDFVATNNGTKLGYFRFDPQILLSARSVSIGAITQTDDDPAAV